MAEVELVALAEADPEQRAQARRRAPAAAVFADYADLLSTADMSAVVICLPNSLHAKAAAMALRQGKHVYLEKPLASSLDEARAVLAAWQDAQTVGMIGFNFRFNKLYQRLRWHLQAGTVGKCVCVRSVLSLAARTIIPAWQQVRESGGGALLDLASHHIDLIHYLFGREVREVFARIESQRFEGDCATLELRLSDGLMVQSFFSLSAVDEDRFDVYGERGKLSVDRHLSLDAEITGPSRDFARLKRLTAGLKSLAGSHYIFQKALAPVYEPSYRTALGIFVAAAQSNQPASPDLWDGYRSLAVIDAAEKSARLGEVVLVPTLGTTHRMRMVPSTKPAPNTRAK
jgi:predicted dehydrogenase